MLQGAQVLRGADANLDTERLLWKVRARTDVYAMPVASRARSSARPRMAGLVPGAMDGCLSKAL
ncbi:MAG: hypothetical protein BGP23_15745 [Lysobacterales bacterium 66-474]|nr:MAG: hypothetical protein ABT18_05725 [Rhodanobacter sp. SCN 66-43]OJY84031.1 MAG: hypothetical protein BGP23_15745 [Xanthomonadales bacterium 66-474]